MTTIKRLFFLVPVLLLWTLNAKADTASVYVSGTYAFANNGYGIPPYGGTLNGQAAAFYCVDFKDDIYGNTSWNATVTNLTPYASYSNTLMKSQTVYLEMAYLVTQMMSTSPTQPNYQTVEADYQWAIWSLSVGNNPSNLNPDGTNAALIGNAQAAVAGNWTPSGNWEILTPLYGSSPQYPNSAYGQEFLVMATPEPSSIVLLLAGLIVFVLIATKK